jgi:hypothetical protein
LNYFSLVRVFVDNVVHDMYNSPMADFKQMRELAKDEMGLLIQQRFQLDRKIMALEQTIKGLDSLCKSEADEAIQERTLAPVRECDYAREIRELGLTEAIRKILRDHGLPLTTKSIRLRLQMFNYEKLPEINPMAAIHGVLRRLVEADEVKPVENDKGKPAYQWKTPLERALGETPNYHDAVLEQAGKIAK